MVTYAASKQGYINLWAKAVIRPQYIQPSKNLAAQITANRARYLPVQDQIGVPWFFVGLLHMRESSFNFNTYLGNGDPLHQVTTHVPAGRGPFATFADGAVDALKLQGFDDIMDWPISRILWAAETYNGQGYFALGVNSPYVWAWTTNYTSGKYVADGVYSASTVDTQPGVGAVLGSLIVTNAEVANYLAAYQEEPVATTTPPAPPVPPTPPAPPVPPDPYDALIAILKAAGKWPAAGTVSIVTAGNVTVIVNGQVVVQGE